MRSVALALLAVLLAGCADHGTAPVAAVGTATPTFVGGEGIGPSSARDPDPSDLQVVADQEFLIDSVDGSGVLPLTWPRAGWAYLTVEYTEGAFMDAAFALGECKAVTPMTGGGVVAGGAAVGVAGSQSHGVLYECGWLAKGPQPIGWTLGAGVLQGRVVAYIER